MQFLNRRLDLQLYNFEFDEKLPVSIPIKFKQGT